jgi:hypothetical protein
VPSGTVRVALTVHLTPCNASLLAVMEHTDPLAVHAILLVNHVGVHYMIIAILAPLTFSSIISILVMESVVMV